jgi:hypothetical protein
LRDWSSDVCSSDLYFNYRDSTVKKNKNYNKLKCELNIAQLIQKMEADLPRLGKPFHDQVKDKKKDLNYILEMIKLETVQKKKEKYLKYKAKYLQLKKLVDELKRS